MLGAWQVKLLKTCSALGVALQPLGPPCLLFSIASLSLACCYALESCLTFRAFVGLPELVSLRRRGSGHGRASTMKGNAFPRTDTDFSLSLLLRGLQRPLAKQRTNRKTHFGHFTHSVVVIHFQVLIYQVFVCVSISQWTPFICERPFSQ